MKKMLSTMLTALVLSAAVVTTVDAYNPTTRKSTKTSTKTRTRGGRSARSSKTAAPAAKDVLMPAKEAVTAQKEQDPAAAKEAAKETVNVLTSPDMTKEQAELVAKRPTAIVPQIPFIICTATAPTGSSMCNL